VALDTTDLAITGPLDPAATLSAIKRSLRSIQACYERSLAQNPELKGKVEVRVVVGPDGRVKQAKVVQTTLGDAACELCVVERASAWSLSASKEESSFTVRFRFQPKQ